jgi:hypothetical protein
LVEPEEVRMSPTLVSPRQVSGALTRVLDAAMNPSVPHDLRVELGLVANWLQQVLDHERELQGNAVERARGAAERSHWE